MISNRHLNRFKQNTENEIECYKTHILKFCAKEYAKRKWVMQIHIGAMRNTNTKMYKSYGPDAGCDSMNDLPVVEKLSKLIDSFLIETPLPKIILYNLNPMHNYPILTMMANFQESPVANKIQFGSG